MKNLFLFFFSLVSFFGFSQDFYDIMAKETCECITSKKLDYDKIDATKLQLELGMCMMPGFYKYKDKLDKSEQVVFGDKEGMRKLGEKIGLKMINHCPDFLIKLGSDYIEKNKNEEGLASVVEETKDTNLGDYKLEGAFVETKANDFLTVVIKEHTGRVHQLLLLNFFENADLITSNKIKANQKIELTYSEHEFYDPKTKDYKYYKVIYSFKVI